MCSVRARVLRYFSKSWPGTCSRARVRFICFPNSLFWLRDVRFENMLIHLLVMERTFTHTFTSLCSFLTTLARGNQGK